MVSDFWKCPHCQNTQEKTDQLKVMAEAKRVNAIVFANVTTRAFPCHFCGQTVDIGDVANGRFDTEGFATGIESDSAPTNPVGAFFAGGIVGLICAGILSLIWRLITGSTFSWWVVPILAGIGAVISLIQALNERK